VPPSDDEETRSSVVGEEGLPSEEGGDEEDDGSGEYVDEEEVENAIVDATTGGQRTVLPIPWGRKHIGHQPDEEDDELMMYAKDNPHSVRTTHETHQRASDRPRLPRRKSITNLTAQQRLSATTNNNTSAPKRRTTETGPGGSSARTKRRR